MMYQQQNTALSTRLCFPDINLQYFLRSLVFASAFLLGACSGGGGGSTTPPTTPTPTTFQMGGAIQGEVPALTTAVTTFAGATDLSLDGTGTAATFNDPGKVATDGTNLYVVDSASHKIRQIVIATGVVTTLAGSGLAGSTDGTGSGALFNSPQGITIDATYTNLYVADTNSHKIRQIVISTGVVTTLAGSGTSGSANGTGTAASFSFPAGITTDGTNLYVADTSNHLIRQIVISSAAVTTLAGTGTPGSTNATGTSASFFSPHGIANDGTNLYVADRSNNLIRQVVISSAVVTTLAGSGLAAAVDASGTAASFNSPYDVTTDGTNVYVADRNNHKVRQIVIATAVVTTLAGSGVNGWADGTGVAASFYYLGGITTDNTNLYVVDTFNQKIRQVVISGAVVSSIAGSGTLDATGTTARFNTPYHVTTDGTNLYLADWTNNLIRQIEIASGVVTTLAGSGVWGSTDGTGTAATFSNPYGITTDGTYLYVADTSSHKIRQIEIATGIVTTLAGSGSSGSLDATGTAATFNSPRGITTDGTSLYVADTYNHLIRQIVISTGVVTTLAGAGTSGSTDATGTSASFNLPHGITTDGTNLYVADSSNHTIRQVVISSAVVTTLAGTALTTGSTDGTGAAALFYFPRGITSDGTNLYVTDENNQRIRQVVISSAVVTTLAGSSYYASVDGTGTAASFRRPFGITTDSTSLYVTDRVTDNVRRIQ